MNSNIVEVNARDNQLTDIDKFLLSVFINLIGWEKTIEILTKGVK